MSDLMVINMGELALPFDQTMAAELTKDITHGLSGGFKRSARLTMGNSGDWELVDSEGEVHDMGREVDIVIVDQRKYNSRIHYAKSFDEQKQSGEFESPDCFSTDGLEPDANVETPYADKCKNCPANKISANWQDGNQMCGTYRRVIGVLVNEDGTFSDPFVLEPKYKSLSDKTVVKERFGSYGWYMNVLVGQKHPQTGTPMPIPTQAVVTRCMPMPKMETATMKFGIAQTKAGGYWTLNKEKMEEILRLKDSDEVQDMLKPFDAAGSNPSSAGRIPVVNVDVDQAEQIEKARKATEEEPKAKSAPAKKTPPVKKEAPKPTPKKKVKMVVLGMEHPDVVNSDEYDYEELKEWAKDASEEEVKEFLVENFPQALEPVEVPEEEPEVEEPKSKPTPKKKAPAKKETTQSNVVDTSTGEAVSDEVAKQVEALTEGLDDFDD